MLYRGQVSWFQLRPSTRIAHVVALVFALVVVLAACGGGSDGAGGTDPEASARAENDSTETTQDQPSTTDRAESAATATALVIPTSTPLPSATALPTSTPEPLEAPTPSSVLLTTAFTNSSKVTTVGIDEVFFGMSPEDAAVAASTDWVELPSGSGTCYRVTPSDGPDGVTLWVVDGFIERLDIEHPDIRTPSKLGLGNTLEELRSQLGDRLTVETAGDGAQVATFTPTDPGDRDFRIIFELEEDRVVRYRSGRIGIIDRAPEGC